MKTESLLYYLGFTAGAIRLLFTLPEHYDDSLIGLSLGFVIAALIVSFNPGKKRK